MAFSGIRISTRRIFQTNGSRKGLKINSRIEEKIIRRNDYENLSQQKSSSKTIKKKVTSHKSYSYKASSIRETTKILSLELTKTFLFLSLWRKLMDRPSSEELSFFSLIFNNLALFPFILSPIYTNRSRIPSAVFYFALILVLSPIYANLTTSISTGKEYCAFILYFVSVAVTLEL